MFTTPVIVAFITGVLGPILVMIVKNKLDQKKPKDMVCETLKVSELITNKIEVIKEHFEADRVWITQFHNGGHFYPTGKSIKKFSIFYERTTDKAASVKDTFQNIPVSLFPKIFSLLYHSGEIAIPDTTNNTVDCGLFPVMGKDYNTKSFYLLEIEDLNGSFIGVLAISYYENKHELSLDEWITVRQKIGAIGSILTDYLHDKKMKSN